MDLVPDPDVVAELHDRALRHHRLAIASEQAGDWSAAEDARAEAQACAVLAMLWAPDAGEPGMRGSAPEH